VTEVLRVSLQENLDMIAETVGYLASRGREVFTTPSNSFDGFAANQDYAAQQFSRAPRRCEAGHFVRHTAAHCRGCCGSNQAAPLILQAARVPVGIHTHTRRIAVANSLAAVDAGAVQVQGTINGHRRSGAGNADLISVMANLGSRRAPVLAAEPLASDRDFAVRL